MLTNDSSGNLSFISESGIRPYYSMYFNLQWRTLFSNNGQTLTEERTLHIFSELE